VGIKPLKRTWLDDESTETWSRDLRVSFLYRSLAFGTQEESALDHGG